MRDNFVHTFLQFLTGQIPDQVTLGGLRWFTVLLYWLLFFGGISVAVINWRRDPRQRSTHHLGVFLLRFTMAGMWYLGTLWKLPLPVSAGFKFWMEQCVKYSSFQLHANIMQGLLNHIAVVQPLVYLLEVFLTASLMLGFAVRLSGIVGALFTLNLLIGLYNDGGEWPWTYVGIICAHGMFAAAHAGRSLGVDNLARLQKLPVLSGDTLLARAYSLAS